MSYRFDRGDKVVLARQPNEYVWVRHKHDLTIGKTYTIRGRCGYSNITAYTILNDSSCIATIEDQYFDPVE